MTTTTMQKTQAKFNEVKATGVFISKMSANHADSMALLKQNGLRLMTYSEALVLIDQNLELKEQLKGKWFYLDGEGSQLSGYYTFNDKGELKEGNGDMEKTVSVCNGNNPLSLGVHTDDDARSDEWRFGLDAFYGPSYVARVVVGVRDGHKVATPKVEAQVSQIGQKLTLKELQGLARDAENELIEKTEMTNLPLTITLIQAVKRLDIKE